VHTLCLFRHSAGNILLLGADAVGVDGGGGELGVAEALLHHVERDAGRGRPPYQRQVKALLDGITADACEAPR